MERRRPSKGAFFHGPSGSVPVAPRLTPEAHRKLARLAILKEPVRDHVVLHFDQIGVAGFLCIPCDVLLIRGALGWVCPQCNYPLPGSMAKVFIAAGVASLQALLQPREGVSRRPSEPPQATPSVTETPPPAQESLWRRVFSFLSSNRG